MTRLDEFEVNNCYAGFEWQGMILSAWQEELKFQYSLGELYRMAKEEKQDFSKLLV